MMYILMDMIETCKDAGLVNILVIVKRAMNLIEIVVPIIAIISLIIILIKLISNPDNKKLKNAFRNWAIALVVVFLLPVIVNACMNLLGDNYSFGTCWDYVLQLDSMKKDSTYNNSKDKRPTNGFMVDPEDYENGVKEEAGNNSSNSTTSSNNNSSNPSINKRIYIGDSRTVQMKYFVVGDSASCSGDGLDWSIHGNDVWSCKGSMGLDWMMKTGIPNISSQISSGTAVIILMGVNDLYQEDNYVKYLNGQAASWISKGAKVYFVSVNPTDGGYSKLNTLIDSFNSKLKNNLQNITYIDTNSYLKNSGFKTTDGLHYDGNTSKKIYSYINSKL